MTLRLARSMARLVLAPDAACSSGRQLPQWVPHFSAPCKEASRSPVGAAAGARWVRMAGSVTPMQVHTGLPRGRHRHRRLGAGHQQQTAVGLGWQLFLQQRLDPAFGAGVACQQKRLQHGWCRRCAPAACCGAGPGGRRRSAGCRPRAGPADPPCVQVPRGAAVSAAARNSTPMRSPAQPPPWRVVAKGTQLAKSNRAIQRLERLAHRQGLVTRQPGHAQQRPGQLGLEHLHGRVLELWLFGGGRRPAR
jgi:hypothetical protein